MSISADTLQKITRMLELDPGITKKHMDRILACCLIPDYDLNDKALSAAETVELSGCAMRTIRRRIADGSLPSRMVGGKRVVFQSELMKWMHGEGEQK